MSVLALLEEVIPVPPLVDLIGAYLFLPEFLRIDLDTSEKSSKYYRDLLEEDLRKTEGKILLEGTEGSPIPLDDHYTLQFQLCVKYLELFQECHLTTTPEMMSWRITHLLSGTKRYTCADRLIHIYVDGEWYTNEETLKSLERTQTREFLARWEKRVHEAPEQIRVFRYLSQYLKPHPDHLLGNLPWASISPGIMTLALLHMDRITFDPPSGQIRRVLGFENRLSFPTGPIYHFVYQALQWFMKDAPVIPVQSLFQVYQKGPPFSNGMVPRDEYFILNSNPECHLSLILGYLWDCFEIREHRIHSSRKCTSCKWCLAQTECGFCEGTHRCSFVPKLPFHPPVCAACYGTGKCPIDNVCSSCTQIPLCNYCFQQHIPYGRYPQILEELGKYSKFFCELKEKLG